jgi:hypothetical protein
MARWNDLSKLRMEMEKLQAQVKQLHNKGCSPSDISYTLDTPERNVRVIIKWRC